MTSTPWARTARAVLIALWALLGAALAQAAHAAPNFPELGGRRVVDEANLLSPDVRQQLTDKLAALEAKTTDQVVVVTVPSLDDTPIEDYGYQLGRHWGIGQKGQNNGVLLIVAPNDRKVRIEVGYGLEPVLTDALSSVIITRTMLPAFRQGDYSGGVVAGTDAIIAQLSLDRGEAIRRAEAVRTQAERERPNPIVVLVVVLVIFLVLSRLFGSLFWPLIFLSSMGRGGGGWSGGGGSFGGGGFSGGGGSFGGGGSSGSW